jgi:HD superfamily phosphohydrolase
VTALAGCLCPFTWVKIYFPGLDVDKVDYLMRDAQATGINIKFDWERYLEVSVTIAMHCKSQNIFN